MEKKSTYKPNTSMSFIELFKKFPDEETARKYLEKNRWNGKPACPHCNSEAVVVLERNDRVHKRGVKKRKNRAVNRPKRQIYRGTNSDKRGIPRRIYPPTEETDEDSWWGNPDTNDSENNAEDSWW